MNEDRKPHKATAGPRDTTRKWKTARRASLGGLGLIAGAALTGLVVAWSGNPSSTTLRYEFAKTCMQVLAVVFFGGLATIATFSFQRSRTREDDQSRREAEQNEKDRERRSRQDDQLRSIVDQTLTVYNRVKRIRRLLAAETHGGHLTLAVYDKHMADLIDEQLAFERLKKLPPFIGDERISLPPSSNAAMSGTAIEDQTLAKTYERIEEYLNEVIGEYEKTRYTVSPGASVSLAGFGELRGFIGDKFKTRVSVQMDRVVDKLLKAFWQPLEEQSGAKMIADEMDVEKRPDDEALRLQYTQVCASYHAIDDFRGKLLALWPILGGAAGGVTLLAAKDVGGNSSYLWAIGLFGMLVSIGIAVYEWAQTLACQELKAVGRQLERDMGFEIGKASSAPSRVLTKPSSMPRWSPN